ncbi:S24 family peptidase [Alloyangia pacifica]|uniref:S24 family peptidase n=1 Tax=Alloyangia pacifica TaxID=311180 RepID=UPI0031D6110E
MEFIKCVEARLEELGLRPSAAEEKFDLPPDTIRNLLRSAKNTSRASAGPTLSKTQQICEALGIEFYFGPPRKNARPPSHHQTIQFIDEFTLISRTLDIDRDGPYEGVDALRDAETLAFRTDWLDSIGSSPEHLCLLRNKSSLMEPLIWDGDTLLIDTKKRSPRTRPMKRQLKHVVHDEIFVLKVDHEYRIMAARRSASNAITLYQENRRLFDPETFSGEEVERLQFIGKVIWWSHVSD